MGVAVDKPHGSLGHVPVCRAMSSFHYLRLGAVVSSSRLLSMAAGTFKGDDGPLLPVPNRLDSFWLTERDPVLQNARTTAELPSTADVVIVGSGLTGAMSAYHLQREAKAQGRVLSIVMLEADECCGSATARNGKCSVKWNLLAELKEARWALQAPYVHWVQCRLEEAWSRGRQPTHVIRRSCSRPICRCRGARGHRLRLECHAGFRRLYDRGGSKSCKTGLSGETCGIPREYEARPSERSGRPNNARTDHRYQGRILGS